jgi:hypothetical protein
MITGICVVQSVSNIFVPALIACRVGRTKMFETLCTSLEILEYSEVQKFCHYFIEILITYLKFHHRSTILPNWHGFLKQSRIS